MNKAGGRVLQVLKQPRARVLWPLVVVLFGILFLYNVCTVYVRPYEMGVKQVILGGEKGIREKVYGPGLHWVTPGAERMHLFPTDLQVLEMADNAADVGEGADHRVVRAIKIQTSEGYTVSVGRHGALPHREPVPGDHADRPGAAVRGLGGDSPRRAGAAAHAGRAGRGRLLQGRPARQGHGTGAEAAGHGAGAQGDQGDARAAAPVPVRLSATRGPSSSGRSRTRRSSRTRRRPRRRRPRRRRTGSSPRERPRCRWSWRAVTRRWRSCARERSSTGAPRPPRASWW